MTNSEGKKEEKKFDLLFDFVRAEYGLYHMINDAGGRSQSGDDLKWVMGQAIDMHLTTFQ